MLRSAAEPVRVGFHEGTVVQSAAGIGLNARELIARRGQDCRPDVDAPDEGIELTPRMRRLPDPPAVVVDYGDCTWRRLF